MSGIYYCLKFVGAHFYIIKLSKAAVSSTCQGNLVKHSDAMISPLKICSASFCWTIMLERFSYFIDIVNSNLAMSSF